MFQFILRYMLIALIVGVILKYTPGINIDDNKICSIILVCIALIFTIDVILKRRVEKMVSDKNAIIVSEEIPPIIADDINTNPTEIVYQQPEEALCDESLRFPHPYTLSSEEEDEIASFQKYDHNLPNHLLIQQTKSPGYYLANNGNYSNKGVSHDKLQSLICRSKMNDLYEQHNHFKWSPHTHIGKSRGYVNWKSFY